MSTRSLGMIGKTYKTALEAFKDADYYVAIERPKSDERGMFWGFVCSMFVVAVFGYSLYLTINNF